jgi:hypothetical protein
MGRVRAAYIEPVAVGDDLPDIELYLTNDYFVMAPLEATYRDVWDAAPEDLRSAVESDVVPKADAK